MNEIEQFCRAVESGTPTDRMPEEGVRFQVCTTYAVPGEVNIPGICSRCDGELFYSDESVAVLVCVPCFLKEAEKKKIKLVGDAEALLRRLRKHL